MAVTAPGEEAPTPRPGSLAPPGQELLIGSFSNDDGDGNENIKTAIGLLSKTSLHVLHAFLYISLLLLLDFDVKVPNFTFYGGRTSDDQIFFLVLNLSAVSKK